MRRTCLVAPSSIHQGRWISVNTLLGPKDPGCAWEKSSALVASWPHVGFLLKAHKVSCRAHPPAIHSAASARSNAKGWSPVTFDLSAGVLCASPVVCYVLCNCHDTPLTSFAILCHSLAQNPQRLPSHLLKAKVSQGFLVPLCDGPRYLSYPLARPSAATLASLLSPKCAMPTSSSALSIGSLAAL